MPCGTKSKDQLPSAAKSRKTRPAIEEELTETVPEFVLFEGTWSEEVVRISAVLVKTCGSDVTVTIRTGTVISAAPPEEKVPRSQTKEVAPAAPVQVESVAVPAVTFTVGVAVSSMPAGSVSRTVTPSASDSPGPVLLRTEMTKSKLSRRLTEASLATLLATSTSARVRTVVGSTSVLLPVSVSNPAVTSSDVTVTVLSKVPLASPRMVTVKLVLVPGSSRGSVQTSVPPMAPPVGAVEQAPPVPDGTVFVW